MKAIVYGHKLTSSRHTQAYVHYGFYKAFKYLGYETIWVDDSDNIPNLDNCIYLTEGQVDKNIPLNKICKYIVHNPNEEKYQNLNKINIQIFHNSIGKNVPRTHPSFCTTNKLIKINNYTYTDNKTIWQPWATDLLPNEIDDNNAKNFMDGDCVWVGSYGDRSSEYQNSIELDLFFNECKKNNIKVVIHNPWEKPISCQENKDIINASYLAPTIQGPWQVKYGYTPCRLFKNISYGHLGITNNKASLKLFDNALIYEQDLIKLFYKIIEIKNNSKCLDSIKYLMNEVKAKHTYVNRLQNILKLI